MDQPKAERDAAEGTDAPHPLDSWLKRELQALYGNAGPGELPDEIAELAMRLEEKLRGGDAGKDDRPHATKAGDAETSTRRSGEK